MAKMYERVKLVRPIHLDLTGGVAEAGTEATIIDLLDDDVVLIEFDIEFCGLERGAGYYATVAKVHDIVTVS